MRPTNSASMTTAVVALSASVALADVSLPAAFTDHMVLQRDRRTHFHVPIFAAQLGCLGTTQSAILDCLAEIDSWPSNERPVLEIETYAWDVLPSTIRDESDLVDGIGREITWCAEQTSGTGGVFQEEDT